MAVAALLASGCASVHIEDPGGQVRVERHLGLLNVTVADGPRSVVAETTGIGLMRNWEGFTLGYHDSTVAVLGRDDCRLILWVQTREDLNEARRLIEETDNVCIVSKEDEP